jgi:CubicO group peptidase (beta-lactamase class C family)
VQRLYLIIAAGVLVLAPAFAGQVSETKQIDSIVAPLVTPASPGVAVLVKQDGRVIFEKGYGVRSLRSPQPITPQTNFRLASFTKQFTAMAIMLLVHDGKLRYDTHLTDVFPEFPAYGKDITVANLLTHTSGLPDYEDLMEKAEKSGGTRWSVENQIQDDGVLALLEKASAGKFVPGTSWAYSNSGYVVLGLIVAKKSGLDYGEFLQQRIFAPLRMNHSIVFRKGKNEVSQRAYCYSKVNGQLVDTDQSSTSATLGDGGVYSNLADLAKWDAALENHTLLSAEEMQPALTPVKLANGAQPHWPQSGEPDGDNLAPGKPVSYGFGWFLDPYENHPRMWHAGSTSGFVTVIQRFTADHLTIVILCNRTDLDPKSISEAIAKLTFESPSK